jgi:hypothetical protein
MDRVAGITSNTVPWEILRAAGYTPRLFPNDPGPTPYADRFMEDVFEPRFRVAFDRLCAGSWTDLSVVVIPRTSEQEHKLYLYLREVSRLGYSKRIPRLYLYNLLHSRSAESYSYGLDRTRHMVRDFQASDDGLREAISESNRARAAVRMILELRQQGRMEGSEAIQMIGGFYSGDRRGFSEQMRQMVSVLKTVTPADRPRILIKGASLDNTGLHRLVEQNGGYVSAEDDWRGSRAAGELDVRTEGDPVVAVFEKYYYDAVSPRVHPPEEADAWFRREIERGQVEGVLFYIPFEDDVVGWDYPRHRAFAQARGVPSLLVRESGAPEPDSGLIAQVSTFVQSLRRV